MNARWRGYWILVVERLGNVRATPFTHVLGVDLSKNMIRSTRDCSEPTMHSTQLAPQSRRRTIGFIVESLGFVTDESIDSVVAGYIIKAGWPQLGIFWGWVPEPSSIFVTTTAARRTFKPLDRMIGFIFSSTFMRSNPPGSHMQDDISRIYLHTSRRGTLYVHSEIHRRDVKHPEGPAEVRFWKNLSWRPQWVLVAEMGLEIRSVWWST
ncbi:hypothetical protein EDC04DRAFT_429798 [Pisolithus marmoratus]|nr:hypothetical protein EDC04DRAFT_429798 [Pisolithus marmoratus]